MIPYSLYNKKEWNVNSPLQHNILIALLFYALQKEEQKAKERSASPHNSKPEESSKCDSEVNTFINLSIEWPPVPKLGAFLLSIMPVFFLP